MDSKKIKIKLMDYFLSYGYLCAMTEFGTFAMCKADVFLVDGRYFPMEIEIKTNKSDLQGELNSIKHCLDNTNPSGDYHTKYIKHRHYLDKIYDKMYVQPSKFLFAVTEELMEQAQEGLKESPYGLIVVPNDENLNPWFVKKAEKLHNDKIDMEIVRNYLKKVSRENLRLRLKYEI